MICPKCGNVITHNSYFDTYYCPRCGKFIREKPPMTNADRIRSMSDEELAEFLYQVGYDHRWGLKEYALEWLQQPAEDSANG